METNKHYLNLLLQAKVKELFQPGNLVTYDKSLDHWLVLETKETFLDDGDLTIKIVFFVLLEQEIFQISYSSIHLGIITNQYQLVYDNSHKKHATKTK